MSELKNVILEKKDGKTTITKLTIEKLNKIRSHPSHKCPDCQNFSICPKIEESVKKTINKYPYITDGIQVINELGGIDNFVVIKCNCFVSEKVKPLKR